MHLLTKLSSGSNKNIKILYHILQFLYSIGYRNKAVILKLLHCPHDAVFCMREGKAALKINGIRFLYRTIGTKFDR